MKSIVVFVISSFLLASVLPVSAYRVSSNSWNVWGNGTIFQRADDTRYYRIFNPSTSYDMFVPGRDDAGNLNL